MATKVYPLLYAFENSVREFIDGHLTAAYGKDWYDEPKLVYTDVRKTVERNRKADDENRTHSARNARPIYYTTFGELVPPSTALPTSPVRFTRCGETCGHSSRSSRGPSVAR